MKNKTLLPAGIVTVMVLVLGIASLGIAATQSTDSYPPIVQKLAERFNLKPADVNAVFEEERKEMDAQRQERHESMLDQAVKDGKITEKQKEAIIAKSEEFRKNMEDIHSLAPEERRDAIVKFRSEIETWAKDNDVDIRYLMFGGKGFRHGGGWFKGGFGGRGPGSCGSGECGPGRFGTSPGTFDGNQPTDQTATQSSTSL